MIIQSASPVFIRATLPEESKTLNIFAAAKGDEIASWDEEKGHGIFHGDTGCRAFRSG